ncbi:hypothetical protein [Streptomyces sp. NBC_01803]|uniref:hypothetical protein n=1 Tax=Streptomyces sp. NBC_01803 TaxID=2975946 RepID=UPI002DDB8889|nr:hypothetical protein [Streptomyces sp. NBC_01803]WSA46090.1 hypothetical protein OIE51_18945 [Streptomyces sp. NBC_01803]
MAGVAAERDAGRAAAVTGPVAVHRITLGVPHVHPRHVGTRYTTLFPAAAALVLAAGPVATALVTAGVVPAHRGPAPAEITARALPRRNQVIGAILAVCRRPPSHPERN